jgi:hypothetical protein
VVRLAAIRFNFYRCSFAGVYLFIYRHVYKEGKINGAIIHIEVIGILMFGRGVMYFMSIASGV